MQNSSSELPLQSRVVIGQNVLTRELDGELVILSLDNETYYGLDEIGARMWAVVSDAGSIGDAVDQLLEEFDVDRVTLVSDLQDLLGKLTEQGLVQIIDE
jgi:hypothetical protein